MKIEPTFKTLRLENIEMNQSFSQSTFFLPKDTIQGISSANLSLCQRIKAFWRMICNWIRGKLFPVLPIIEPRVPVKKNQMDYFRTVMRDSIQYQIRIDGVPTPNGIKFSKSGQDLNLLELNFPDAEMHEHISSILEHVLKEEGATTFSTCFLEKAKLLWNCGYVTDAEVVYNPTGKEVCYQLISSVIEKAKQKKKSLSVECLQILQKIEKAMVPDRNLLSSFVSLGASVVGKDPIPTISFPLVDLFKLVDAIGGTQFRGTLVSASENSRLVHFKKI